MMTLALKFRLRARARNLRDKALATLAPPFTVHDSLSQGSGGGMADTYV